MHLLIAVNLNRAVDPVVWQINFLNHKYEAMNLYV